TYPPAADLIDSGANVVDETRLLAGIMSKHQQKNLAVSLLQKLLIKHPHAIAARLQLASLQTRQGSLQEAEQIIKGGEHPEAPSAELAFNLAGIYLLQKQDKLAEAHYRRVMELAQLKGFGWEAGIRLVSMLMDQGRLADVQPLLEQLRKRQPNNLYVHMFDAWILAFKGKIPESLAILHQISKRAPRFIPGLQMFARVHIQKGENEEALGYLRQALALDGTNSATHMALGNLLVKMNQIPEAMQSFRKVLELVPGHMEAMETMVTLEMKIGRTSQALLWSEYIQTVYPLLPQGYYWQGLVHQLRGNFSKARAAFEQAWERTPGSPQVVMAIVTTYTSEKQYSQALSYLEKLIPQYPDGAIYPYLQGGVLLLQNKKPEAEAAFRQALARQPDWSVPYRDLGQLRLESGDLTGSKALLENGMKIDPRDPYLHYLWGRVHMESGDLPAARQSFKKALMYQPDLENAANYLAMLLLDYPEAPEDAANALQVAKRFANSVHPDMQDTLGWAYFKNGDLDNALLFLNKAATGENREPTLYFHLGMVHEKRGDEPLTRQYLQQALETRNNYDWLAEARARLLRVAPSQ
ncbi:MAG: tetratricopeptide repeat protein, partial [Magnetococcales bacterium]|nr:tetratricopeptide repeat protein [Magnetococcales bacterium]